MTQRLIITISSISIDNKKDLVSFKEEKNLDQSVECLLEMVQTYDWAFFQPVPHDWYDWYNKYHAMYYPV